MEHPIILYICGVIPCLQCSLSHLVSVVNSRRLLAKSHTSRRGVTDFCGGGGASGYTAKYLATIWQDPPIYSTARYFTHVRLRRSENICVCRLRHVHTPCPALWLAGDGQEFTWRSTTAVSVPIGGFCLQIAKLVGVENREAWTELHP